MSNSSISRLVILEFINALVVFLLSCSANEDIGRKQDPTDLRITNDLVGSAIKTSFEVISTEDSSE